MLLIRLIFQHFVSRKFFIEFFPWGMWNNFWSSRLTANFRCFYLTLPTNARVHKWNVSVGSLVDPYRVIYFVCHPIKYRKIEISILAPCCEAKRSWSGVKVHHTRLVKTQLTLICRSHRSLPNIKSTSPYFNSLNKSRWLTAKKSLVE